MSILWNPAEATVVEKVSLPIITTGTQNMGDGIYWLKAGTPLDEDLAVANNGGAMYIVAEDFFFVSTNPNQDRMVPVIKSGYVDLNKAEAAAGITFTAEAKTSLSMAGVALVDELADQFHETVGDVGTKIVSETTVAFSSDAGTGQYISAANPITGMTFEADKIYKVLWDGNEYWALFKKMPKLMASGVGVYDAAVVGDTSIVGMADTFDLPSPFIITKNWVQSESDNIYILTSESGSHTVEVYAYDYSVSVPDSRVSVPRTGGENVPIISLGSNKKGILIGPAYDATGVSAVAIGDGVKASGARAIAVGCLTSATEFASYAEGLNTQSGGTASHAEGAMANASGHYSHAEGQACTSSGVVSHAEGGLCTASGQCSHAQGQRTTANHLAQFAFGFNNIPDPSTAAATARGNYIEIVGNGPDKNTPGNARTLDWSGNESLAGGITLGMGTADETTLTATQLKALLALLS